MNKILKSCVLGLAVIAPAFIASDAFAAEQINEIHISSHAESAQAGKLMPFDAAVDPSYITAEDYGSNTNWARWEEGADSSWHGFGSEEPIAVQDGKTHYALRILVTADEGYVFSDSPTIRFTKGDSEDSEDFTNRGYSMFTPNEGNTNGYVYIDLGFATEPAGEGEEPVFTVTYDFNGGATFNGEETYTTHSVAVAPALNADTLIECFDYDAEANECHPLDVYRGKELEYVTVNGERHDLGDDDGYLLNKDTTIVYYWIDHEPNKVAEDEAGNSASFYEPNEEREFTLQIYPYSFSMTDEELEEMGIDRAEYEAGKAIVLDAVGEYGDTLAYIEFEICATDEDYCVHDGPIDVKLRLSDDMKGHNIYKLVFVDIIDDGAEVIVDDPVICELDETGDYILCTLPHLSGYALVVSDEGAPNTGVLGKIREGFSESIVLAVIVATAFVSAGIFLIVSETRR